MAARIIRELTSDEVERHNGLKFGDFGTGGRTYHHYSKGGSSCDTFCFKIIIVIAWILIGWAWWASEASYQHVHQCGEFALHNAETLTPPFTTSNPLIPLLSTKIIHVPVKQPRLASAVALDPYFNVEGGENTVELTRTTEYCQWHEMVHSERVLVGRDPNCEPDATGDSCNIYDTKTSFSYLKMWSPRLIDSNFFDNPVAYQNSKRDPCPSHTFYSGDVVLDGSRVTATDALRMRPEDVAAILPQQKTLSLSASSAIGSITSSAAFADGFVEIDGRRNYIYSRGNEDGWMQVATTAAMGYFIDGVVGTSLLSSCHTGDIRISFQRRGWEEGQGFTVIGTTERDAASGAVGTLVSPFFMSVQSSKCLLGLEGSTELALEEVVGEIEHRELKWLWIYRLCYLLAACAGMGLWWWLNHQQRRLQHTTRNDEESTASRQHEHEKPHEE